MSDLTKALDRLPRASWTTDPDVIAPHLVEWRDKYRGRTPLMLTPGSTEEVVEMVGLCAERGLKIVPQGGNTGLVGGQTPQGEVLISLKRMRAIRDVDPLTNSLVAEAGATLQEVQEAAAAVDRKFPLSLAAQGTCTIGGNISTNAGGVHVLKYGTMRDLVFGVEAVLADGSVHRGLTTLRKDNTGYDLNRLFIGAEGTLGIVTAATLKLFARPGHVQRVMVGLGSATSALALLERARVDDHLAMFEVMPRIGLELTLVEGEQRDPFDAPHDWYAVIDWEVASEARGMEIAEAVLGPALEDGLVGDAVIAQSESQAADILSLRENLSAAQKRLGGSVKLDITVPISAIPEFLVRADAVVERIVPGCRPVAFGHFGDGNIHYNVAQPVNDGAAADREAFLENWQAISEAVFDIVDGLGGSISAEHGIGIMKRADLAMRADPVKMRMLRSIKTALDPDGVMNPRVLV